MRNDDTPYSYIGVKKWTFGHLKGKMLEISILGILTIFGIGSQYFSNLAYSLNQGILQTSFGIGSQYLIIPSVIANFAFALGVPLGHTLTHKFGFRRNFYSL